MVMGADGVDIARTMRARRRALGLTRARLADATGIASVDLTRWERGDGLPTAGAVVVLAEALGLDIAETRAWLDSVTIDLTGSDVSVEFVASEGASPDPFLQRPAASGENAGPLGAIADRLARDEERQAVEEASITPIRTGAPPRPSPSTATGLVRAPRSPRQAAQLPSVFPDPAFDPSDPVTHVYSAGPVRPLSEDEEQLYLLRRIRTAAVVIGLGLLLWWAVGSLWEGLGDVLDLFRAPVSGG